jgi:hypothetical protein
MSLGGDRDRLDARVRSILDEWFWLFALAAVVVAGLGGYAAYTAYADPGVTTEERQVSSWEGNGSYTTATTVTEPNPLYAEGTELVDRPAYFMRASPRLDVTFSFGYTASDDGRVDVTVGQTLVLRAVDSGDGDATVETEYWRIEEPLETTTVRDVAPGDPVRSTVTRNVSAVSTRTQEITERLGGTPGETEILIVSSVDVSGEINGRSVERTVSYRFPITVGASTYRPGGVRGAAVSGSATRTVTRQRTYGPPWRIGGPVALGVGVAAFVGLAYGRYDGRFATTSAERERLRFEADREEFDDWITTARPQPGVLDRPRIEVDSLSGLVDAAIDVDARVFERPDREAFYVLDDDLLYVYTPPDTGVDGAGDGATEG